MSLAVSIVLIVAGGVAQYWLPKLIEDKAEIESYLSRLSKQKITVSKLTTSWDGIYPGIRATDIKIEDPATSEGSITLKEIRLSLSYLSVLKGNLILHRLVLVEPELEIVRDTAGKVSVSGIRSGTDRARRPKPSTNNNKAANWLFAQGKIEIQNGKIDWIDSLENEWLELNKVNLSLKNNGNRHKLDFSAKFPDDICSVCTFSIDIEGNPLISNEWGGFIDVNAIGLKLRNRLTILTKKIPAGLAGTVDLVLRSQWATGKPRLAYGRVTANEVSVPLGEYGKSLAVNELISTVKWRSRKNTWSLEMNLPFVRINNESWLPGQLNINRYVGGTGLYLRHLDIQKALSVAERFNIPEKPRQLLQKLNPAGSVDELYIDLKNKDSIGDRFEIKANLRGLQTSPYKKIPGVKGISANIVSTENSGEVFLDTRRGEFNSTHIFREPIPIHRATARINWQKKNNVLEIITQNIQMIGRDLSARGGFVFKLPLDKSISPEMDLRAEIFNGVAAKKSLYLPVNVLKPKLVKWLDKSIISGHVTTGHVVYRGKVREFPFVNNNGLFEVLANVEHGKLNYLPGWQPITNAKMKLLFRGRSMIITGSSGKVGELDINEIVARKDNLKDKTEAVRITGRATGPVNSSLAILRSAVANGQKGGWTRFVDSDVSGSGTGQLSLGIEIPGNGKKYRLNGQYEFLGSDMVMPVGDIPFTRMRGAIRFNEKRLLGGHISASALGGPVETEVIGPKNSDTSEVSFRLAGRMSVRGLSREYGKWIARYSKGTIPWFGSIDFKSGLPNISLQGGLADLGISLPAPVKQLSKLNDRILLETASSSQRRHVVKLTLGNQASGLFDYHSKGKHWKFEEGKILVGEGLATLAGDAGMHMEFRGERVNADQWVDVIYGKNSGAGSMPELMKGVRGRFQEVYSLGRDWGKAEFNVSRTSSNKWSGVVDADAMKGKVSLDSGVRGGKILLDLVQLHVPDERKTKPKKTSKKKYDPRYFPTLGIVSQDFSIGTKNLGRLDFYADHTRIGWEIDRFQLTRPDMSIFANGTWYRIAGNYVTKGRLRFTSSDLGQSLTALGSPDQVTGGTMNMDISANWRQDHRNKGLANLNGELSILAQNGKFNKLENSSAKAVGAFSLSALSRYLSLDFSTAFGKGFAFDKIAGKISIQQGDARTNSFTIAAPAASVVARGHIGLHKRDIDMHADIYPNLKGGVTVATGSIFGLQAAAWVFALQQIFSSEIEEGTRISYRVTGSLDKPKVTKVVNKFKKNR